VANSAVSARPDRPHTPRITAPMHPESTRHIAGYALANGTCTILSLLSDVHDLDRLPSPRDDRSSRRLWKPSGRSSTGSADAVYFPGVSGLVCKRFGLKQVALKSRLLRWRRSSIDKWDKDYGEEGHYGTTTTRTERVVRRDWRRGGPCRRDGACC